MKKCARGHPDHRSFEAVRARKIGPVGPCGWATPTGELRRELPTCSARRLRGDSWGTRSHPRPWIDRGSYGVPGRVETGSNPSSDRVRQTSGPILDVDGSDEFRPWSILSPEPQTPVRPSRLRRAKQPWGGSPPGWEWLVEGTPTDLLPRERQQARVVERGRIIDGRDVMGALLVLHLGCRVHVQRRRERHGVAGRPGLGRGIVRREAES
jgi:hypothetical protein